MQDKLINRSTYKRVKKMDRKEMESFLAKLYREGFQAGVEAGDNADFKIKLSKVLNKTKGIGTVMYNRIMESVKEEEE